MTDPVPDILRRAVADPTGVGAEVWAEIQAEGLALVTQFLTAENARLDDTQRLILTSGVGAGAIAAIAVLRRHGIFPVEPGPAKVDGLPAGWVPPVDFDG